MECTIKVFGKEYPCNVVEQFGRAKGTRYKAFGTFDGIPIEKQASSIPLALKKLKRRAEIALDF